MGFIGRLLLEAQETGAISGFCSHCLKVKSFKCDEFGEWFCESCGWKLDSEINRIYEEKLRKVKDGVATAEAMAVVRRESTLKLAIPILWKNALAVVMLMIAMDEYTDYGFYTLLRIVIFLLALGGAWSWYTRKAKIWPWLLIGVAILYNPLIKVSFDRDNWVWLNILTIVIFVVEGYYKFRRIKR